MDVDHPDISVALCTYNGARYIAEQIRSICEQSLPPQSIVVSDDASTDGCVDVARAELDACMRERPGLVIGFREIRNATSLRVTRNFEQAVRACSGGLIALCDQDDVWHPERLERMVTEFVKRPDLLLLHSDARLVDGERRDLGHSLFRALEVTPLELAQIHAGQAFDALLRRNLVTGATTMFRRSLLNTALPFPKEWVHDEWLGIVAAAIGRVDVIEDELIDYRQHANNQIGASRNTFIGNVRKAVAPRGAIHFERASKAELLRERLEAIGAPVVSPAKIDLARGKVAHQRFRSLLPRVRAARFIPVAREALSGRYDRFGRGFRAIVSDLLEAA